MEKFNLSKEAMQKLESLKNTLNSSNAVSTQHNTLDGCGTCWGGGCANGFTG